MKKGMIPMFREWIASKKMPGQGIFRRPDAYK